MDEQTAVETGSALEPEEARAVRPATDETEEQRETRTAQAVMARAHFDLRTVSLVILTWLAVLYTLYFASDIILPIVLAIILNLLLAPAMRLLSERLHVPKMLSALLLIVVLFSLIGAIGYAISMPASAWIAKAPQTLPELQRKLRFLREPIAMFQHGLSQVEQLLQQGSGSGGGQTVTVQQGSGVGAVILEGTRAFLGQVFTLVLVLFFLLASGDSLLRRFVEVLPTFKEKRRAVQIATEIERNISGYLVTISAMNLLVGTLNGLSIYLLGLPDPLLFGTLAFLLNYIPILGPMTGIVIYFFVGLFTYSSVLPALVPAGIYLLIHLMEGETITPMLLARRFTLNPLLVILALMFWDWLWGIPGALLAVPLLAVLKVVCDHIETLTPLGHLLGATETSPRRRRLLRSRARTAE